MSAPAGTWTSYTATGPAPAITGPTRILEFFPESERAAFVAVAEAVLLHHRSDDAEGLSDDLYLAYEVIADLAAHYGDQERHEAAECVQSSLIADYEEADDFIRWLFGRREARRRANAAARKAKTA